MDRKYVHWIVLIVSTAFILGLVFVLVVDLNFFITRKETTADVIEIRKPSDYQIDIKYYNDNIKEDVHTTVTLKSSYKEEVENFGPSVSIYYSGLFPQNVYIQNCKVPRKGIVVIEVVMLLLMFFGFKSGFKGVKGK